MKMLFFLFFFISPMFSLDFSALSAEGKKKYPSFSFDLMIVVQVSLQRLFLVQQGKPIKSYIVSTGRGGESSVMRSEGTPLGWHRIWLAVGEGEPLGRWIHYKKVTDKIIPITTDETLADGDYLITRVLALDGLEEGRNKGGNVDSSMRGINIHGTPEEGRLGRKVSRGCIRMANRDVVELFDWVKTNTPVYIAP